MTGGWKCQFHLNCVVLFPLFIQFPNEHSSDHIDPFLLEVDYHIPAVLYDMLRMRLTHLIATSPDETFQTLLSCSFPLPATVVLEHVKDSIKKTK